MGRKKIRSDIEIPQSPSPITFRDGEVSTHNVIETVGEPINSAFMEEIAFMEDPITVIVAETTDKNAEKVVPVGNNGKFMFFTRGIPKTCARKFVDSLIVKATTVSTEEVLAGANERSFVIRGASALKYPFTIVEDKNPKGIEWLRQRLAIAI